MTAILAIAATSHTLWAVVHDHAVRLWIQLDYRSEPSPRCLIDGRPVSIDPPRDAPDALHLVASLVKAPGVTISAVTLLVKLDDRLAFPSALAAFDAAQIAWPNVPRLAWFGTQPDANAVMDAQVRELLRGSDHRAERILDYPRGHFVRAREQARAQLKE
jgi:hypothetical protein